MELGSRKAVFLSPDINGKSKIAREDIGRHNAVDKVVGNLVLGRALPARARLLAVSGRASFEIVQKAVMAGIPFVFSVSAASSLAIDLAERMNVTLAAFVRDGGMNVRAGGAVRDRNAQEEEEAAIHRRGRSAAISRGEEMGTRAARTSSGVNGL